MDVKQCGNQSPPFPLSECVSLLITASTPHCHSCLFNFPKWPLPSLAGMLTFYPDSKHRTSVNPSAAPPSPPQTWLCTREWKMGRMKEEKRKEKQVLEAVNRFSWAGCFTRFLGDLHHSFFHLSLLEIHIQKDLNE